MLLKPNYTTHFYYSFDQLKENPHVVNIYLDYNCPFSGKFYNKFYEEVIPKLEAAHPNKFQLVFINVVQPWHPNLVYLNEFALAFAKLLRENNTPNANKLFWEFNNVVFHEKVKFYDTVVQGLTRNQSYENIYDVVAQKFKFPFDRDTVLKTLYIKANTEEPNNDGNQATADIKYFTKFLRTTNIHVTPLVQINGVNVADIELSTPPDTMVEKFAAHL